MRVAYYPGCSLEGSAIEYGVSTERTAEILGFELVEIDDWNCCGATSGHNTDKLLSIALPARNLAIAEKTGLNVLAPCAACYNRFRNTEHTVRSDSELKAKVEQVIGMEYKAENETYSILNYITQEVGLDKIADKVTKPLKGMKAACYYGCLLVRPEAHTGAISKTGRARSGASKTGGSGRSARPRESRPPEMKAGRPGKCG